MGLDFLSIKDLHGVAIFLIHDGTRLSAQRMEHLADTIKRHTRKQVIVLSVKDHDAMKLIDFYDLQGHNLALLIRDDDQLHQVWHDKEIPSGDQIAYLAEQTG